MTQENNMNNRGKLALHSCVILLSIYSTVEAAVVDVDCNTSPPGALSTAVAGAAAGTTINVSGTCRDAVIIDKDDITLVGNLNGSKASITGFFPQDRITIDGASRVQISGFVIENGVFGIFSTANASFTLRDSDISNNILGMDVNNGSNAFIEGIVTFSNNQSFGFEVINSSTLTIQGGAVCETSANTLGAQISVNSSLFAERGAGINVMNNATIGLSVNTGSTGMLFNANLNTHDNGLDGLDVVSAANFEIDGDSEINSENNGRDGVSIDNSTLNMFGFFSTQPGFPRLTSRANGGNGILVEEMSKLDVGRNSSIVATDNGAAGVNLDDGSSARIQRGNIVKNTGTLRSSKDKDLAGTADVVVSFGSRVSFDQGADSAGNISANQVGVALCDKTALARGDVKCKVL